MRVLSTILLLASPLLSLSQVVTDPVTISDWDVSAYLKNETDYAFVKVSSNIDVTFTYTQGAHSVVEFSSSDDFINCNTANATVLADTNTTEYVLSSSTRKKPFLLASGVSGECEAGSKIKIKYAKRKFDKKNELCTDGSTEIESFLLEGKGKGVKSPAKVSKKCMKACAKNSSCMGGEWLSSVTGKGKDRVKTRSCTLYSDIPTASGVKPEAKKDKAVCFYPKS